MTCPVPRESDSEKILKWLGYRHTGKFTMGVKPSVWVKSDACVYTRVLDTDRDRLFLPGEYPADPQLDYLVLEKVRTLSGNARDQFASNLEDIWWKRSETMLALAPLEYLPGDYAEAARFLWEGE